MYKALITDLDGSAVIISSYGEDVDEETRAAVARAQAEGLHIACATGRQWIKAKPVIEALGIKSLCIVSGGSAIVNSETEEVIWKQPLTPRTTHEILAIFKRHATMGDLYIPEAPFEAPLKDIVDVSDELLYMYMIGIPSRDAEAIIDAVAKSGLAVAHHTPSWEGNGLQDVHVTHPGATKEHALKVWHRLQGVSVEETIAMGDSGNDRPLFRAAGLKVATGNATGELKALADYIAPPVTDHALKHVIDKFLLGQS